MLGTVERWASGLLVMAALAVTVGGCDRFRSPSERGMNALGAGEYATAVSAFDEAAGEAEAAGDTDALAIAYANRCFAKDALGNHEDAADDCSRALELKPGDVEILNNRGVAHLNALSYDKAEADFDAAIEAEPNYAEAYANRGRLHIDREDFGLAIEDLTRAVELDPDLVEALANRAYSHDSLGDVDEALADYDRALEVRRDQYTLFQRGMMHYRYGRFEEAYQDFKEAADQDEATVVGYMARSQADLLESNPAARESEPTGAAGTTATDGADGSEETGQ